MIRPFGTLPNGQQVDVIRLQNGILSCEIITFGAALRTLVVQGKDGPVDVVLGYDDLDSYVNLGGHLGATVGRHANRIAYGKFTLDGVEYQVNVHKPPHHIHGGKVNFSHLPWRIKAASEDALTLVMDSPDGDEGFPGHLVAEVTYRLVGSALELHYRAVTDKPTLCNLTNHSYFNLAGHASGPVLDQELQMSCARYTPADSTNIPTGELAPVVGTPMDFSTLHPIGDHLHDDFDQLNWCGGYDQNYVIDGALNPDGTPAPQALRSVALARSEKTGITMECLSTLPGVQLYTANGLKPVTGKGGALYGPYHAFCLETQFFPDAINHSQFPAPILRPGEPFDSVTRYVFSR